MFFKGKKILVIGGTGTIGKKIVDELLEKEVGVLRVYSRDEYKQFIMAEEYHKKHKNIRFLLGDVRDKERLDRAMKDIDIVFNLAAMKHVPAAEYNPFEAVKTNVMGTQNVIDCAIDNGVSHVIYTSSDKAVSPTNTMGATKLLAERLIASADFHKGNSNITFAAVRFGNVMGSRGSVVPLWKDQILNSSKITITEPQMTRFMMTVNDAVKLTLSAGEKAEGGEIFVLKMPVIKLIDLAEVVIEEVCKQNSIDKKSIKIEKIGLRPGEKLYEELMTIKEAGEALDFGDMFSIYPPHKIEYINKKSKQRASEKAYSSESESPMTKEEIREYILKNNLT